MQKLEHQIKVIGIIGIIIAATILVLTGIGMVQSGVLEYKDSNLVFILKLLVVCIGCYIAGLGVAIDSMHQENIKGTGP